MPLLTVLTAAIGRWAGYVRDAGESLTGQELPEGWEMEWVVQEDGEDPVLAGVVGGFPFARYEANGQSLGIAATRNLALARSGGSLTQTLDCDDVILPGGPAAVIDAFETHPDIHWVATQADDLLPDGTRVAFDPVRTPGYVEAGFVTEHILEHGYSPFLQNGVAYRTATIRALGGWVATPHGEDFAMHAAITELAPGYYTPEVIFLYRQHDEQTSRRPEWISRRSMSLDMVLQRITALRSIGLRIGTS